MRIVIIVLPDSGPEGSRGSILQRIIEPYYAFLDHGAEIDVATLSGGSAWSRNEVLVRAREDVLAARFDADRTARDLFADCLQFEQITAEDFDAAFCVGVPTRRDQADDGGFPSRLAEALVRAGRPIAVVPSTLEIAGVCSGAGLLVLGSETGCATQAAQALLGALGTAFEQRTAGSQTSKPPGMD